MNIPGYCGTIFHISSEIDQCINRYSGMIYYTLINQYESEINANITEALKTIILTPVIYDEVTNFNDTNSYPYEKWKNILNGNMLSNKQLDYTLNTK